MQAAIVVPNDLFDAAKGSAARMSDRRPVSAVTVVEYVLWRLMCHISKRYILVAHCTAIFGLAVVHFVLTAKSAR